MKIEKSLKFIPWWFWIAGIDLVLIFATALQHSFFCLLSSDGFWGSSIWVKRWILQLGGLAWFYFRSPCYVMKYIAIAIIKKSNLAVTYNCLHLSIYRRNWFYPWKNWNMDTVNRSLCFALTHTVNRSLYSDCHFRSHSCPFSTHYSLEFPRNTKNCNITNSWFFISC